MDLYELKAFPIRCLPVPIVRMNKYQAVRGHQDYGMDEVVEIPEDIFKEYHMLRTIVGMAFEDSLFHELIKHLNLDFFQWKEYRKV
jgi:hypothetical protein